MKQSHNIMMPCETAWLSGGNGNLYIWQCNESSTVTISKIRSFTLFLSFASVQTCRSCCMKAIHSHIGIIIYCRLVILTTNWAARARVRACVCVCVCKIWPISALTFSFRLQTSRKFCSHSKIPIRCLWTAFCVPLSFIFYEKQPFRMQSSRFAASPLALFSIWMRVFYRRCRHGYTAVATLTARWRYSIS